jgi:hypothetical protein
LENFWRVFLSIRKKLELSPSVSVLAFKSFNLRDSGWENELKGFDWLKGYNEATDEVP